MIELKKGLGGSGLQPYNTKTGKWVSVDIFLEGNSEPITDFDTFKRTFFASSPEIEEKFDSLPQEHPIRGKIEDYLKEKYNSLLTNKVKELNEEEFEGEEAEFFTSIEDMSKNLPNLISPEILTDLVNNVELNNVYGKGSHGTMPKWIIDLHKKRYGRVKFKRLSKLEFEQKAKEQGSTFLYRGLGDIPAGGSEIKKRIFDGFSRDGKDLSVTLLANGSNGRLLGSGIYMAHHKNFSVNNYAPGNNMLVRAMYNKENCHVALRSEIEKLSSKIYDNEVFKSELSKIADEVQANRFLNRIRRDVGLCAMLMGYDIVIHDGDDNYSIVLNPNNMYMCSEWEGN